MMIAHFHNNSGGRPHAISSESSIHHDMQWASDEVTKREQGEARSVIELMDDYSRHSLQS